MVAPFCLASLARPLWRLSGVLPSRFESAALPIVHLTPARLRLSLPMNGPTLPCSRICEFFFLVLFALGHGLYDLGS